MYNSLDAEFNLRNRKRSKIPRWIPYAVPEERYKHKCNAYKYIFKTLTNYREHMHFSLRANKLKAHF